MILSIYDENIEHVNPVPGQEENERCQLIGEGNFHSG